MEFWGSGMGCPLDPPIGEVGPLNPPKGDFDCVLLVNHEFTNCCTRENDCFISETHFLISYLLNSFYLIIMSVLVISAATILPLSLPLPTSCLSTLNITSTHIYLSTLLGTLLTLDRHTGNLLEIDQLGDDAL